MTIDELIAAHEKVVDNLRQLKAATLTAQDAALSLRDAVAFMQQRESYGNIEMKLTFSDSREPEIEWNIWDGRRHHKGGTLADAFRAAFHPEGVVDRVAKELS